MSTSRIIQDQELPPSVSGDAAPPHVPPRALSQAQVDEFVRSDVLVVTDVLSPAEVAAARAGLHAELAKYGVVRDHFPVCIAPNVHGARE